MHQTLFELALAVTCFHGAHYLLLMHVSSREGGNRNFLIMDQLFYNNGPDHDRPYTQARTNVYLIPVNASLFATCHNVEASDDTSERREGNVYHEHTHNKTIREFSPVPNRAPA